LYDYNIYASRSFPVAVISVGNLTVGGTGKTPHVEYLARLLQTRQLAILSRGYKRQTTGFLLAGKQASAATIGDEPYQYSQAFPEVKVAVCENRVQGIQKLMALFPQTEVILLDDAFQHRPVQPRLNILITDYHRLFFQDYVLPAGRLRESRTGARRADIIIVSKVPANTSKAEKDTIGQQVQKYSRAGVPVFFTTYTYQTPVSFGLPAPFSRRIILVTGIAQPGPLVQYLQEQHYILLKHFKYPDHHDFNQKDLKEISNFAELNKEGGLNILTTQKDWTKLKSQELETQVQDLPFFYVPIAVQFLENKSEFERLILNTIVKT
jgi:tetraacyldisaccharide 4'-kinase